MHESGGELAFGSQGELVLGLRQKGPHEAQAQCCPTLALQNKTTAWMRFQKSKKEECLNFVVNLQASLRSSYSCDVPLVLMLMVLMHKQPAELARHCSPDKAMLHVQTAKIPHRPAKKPKASC